MGETRRVPPTGAVAYQRHTFVIRFLSETEVAHGTGRYNHRRIKINYFSKANIVWVNNMYRIIVKEMIFESNKSSQHSQQHGQGGGD